MNRIFLTVNKNSETKEPIFLKESPLPIQKHHLKDVIQPSFSHEIEHLQNLDVQFIGTHKHLLGFVDQHADNNLSNILLYKYSHPHTVVSHKVVPIQNIVGSRSFDNKILLEDWKFCLLFSQHRLSLHISSVIFGGEEFQGTVLNSDILVLEECQRSINARAKYCISHESDLLAVIQPYCGNVFDSLTIDVISLLSTDSSISLKSICRRKLEIPSQSKLLDCEFICRGGMLVVITDSPSKGNLFICCSIDPLMKLFSTKIQCNRNNGWFFLHDDRVEGSDHHLLTIRDIENDDKLIELFLCGDDRNFIPLKRWTLSSIGVHLCSTSHSTVSNNTLFITNDNAVYVVDILHQCQLRYRLVLPGHSVHGGGGGGGDLQLVSVSYNGFEVFVVRKIGYRIENVEDDGVDSDDDVGDDNDDDEEDVDLSHHNYYVDVFFAPRNTMSLYGLSRLTVLKLYSVEEIKRLPLPRKFKNELMALKQ